MELSVANDSTESPATTANAEIIRFMLFPQLQPSRSAGSRAALSVRTQPAALQGET
jgi:hypothetical protein